MTQPIESAQRTAAEQAASAHARAPGGRPSGQVELPAAASVDEDLPAARRCFLLSARIQLVVSFVSLAALLRSARPSDTFWPQSARATDR